MKRIPSFALAAVAALSLVVFSSPAAAGMIETPGSSAAPTERELALETVRAQLRAHAGADPALDARLASLGTPELVSIAGQMQAADMHAGSSTGVAIAAIIVAGIIVVLVLYFVLFHDHH